MKLSVVITSLGIVSGVFFSPSISAQIHNTTQACSDLVKNPEGKWRFIGGPADKSRFRDDLINRACNNNLLKSEQNSHDPIEITFFPLPIYSGLPSSILLIRFKYSQGFWVYFEDKKILRRLDTNDLSQVVEEIRGSLDTLSGTKPE